MARRDVEFRSQGEVCAGWLYVPDDLEGSVTAVDRRGIAVVEVVARKVHPLPALHGSVLSPGR